MQDDIAPFASISTVGATTRDILLPAETYATIPTIATFYKNRYFVYKHCMYL
jgi:hypothetical protein